MEIDNNKQCYECGSSEKAEYIETTVGFMCIPCWNRFKRDEL